jgi:putative SOS response-associated peptidase YedK
MCTLYRLRKAAAEVAHLFGARLTAADLAWKDEIYPRYDAPVIIADAGERSLGLMRWGFPAEVPGKTRRLTRHVTNARNLASPFWMTAAANPARRCLVPFTAFAEPRPGKDAQGRPAQYWFTLPDRPVAAFAGLWRPGGAGPLFAFATTEPNALVVPLHPRAMPVILLEEDHDRWLAGSYDDVLALQAPYPSQLMTVE